jgi:hypothetical protein
MRPVCWLNVVFGFWLFESRFFWVHSPDQFANSGIVGVLHTSVAVAAIGCPAVRYANGALALWLCASAFVLPLLAQATFWNNVILSVAMLIVAALSGPPRGTRAHPFSASTGSGQLARPASFPASPARTSAKR